MDGRGSAARQCGEVVLATRASRRVDRVVPGAASAGVRGAMGHRARRAVRRAGGRAALVAGLSATGQLRSTTSSFGALWVSNGRSDLA